MKERVRRGEPSHEAHEAGWQTIIDHMTQAGDRIVVYIDVYRPDDPSAYIGVRLSREGKAFPMTVVAPSSGTDEYRRWNRHIEFSDGSRIVIDVQRFEVWYHCEGRQELLIPV